MTELKEIGAGIAISANGMKVLDSLSLTDAVLHIGAEPEPYQLRSWRGAVLSRVPVAELSEKVGATSAAAHRADLHGIAQGASGCGRRSASRRQVRRLRPSRGVYATFSGARLYSRCALIGWSLGGQP